jgi:electron transport complex protein RnfB
MMNVIFAVLVLGVIAVVFGLILSVAAKAFEVKVDERLPKIQACLAGANCGGCGYPGCAGCAEAILAGKAPVTACAPAGAEGAAKIAEIMGMEAPSGEKQVAHVLCNGGEASVKNFEYVGLHDCVAATKVAGGPTACSFGCMGFGTCVAACQFDAIHINAQGVAEVDKEKCTNCGACREACPRKLIVEVPYKQKVFVNCSNKEKGPAVTKVCANSCIACGMCERTCKFDAIHVINNVAVIDYDKCRNCTMCAKACPRNAIEPTPTPEEKEKFKAAQKAAAERKAAAAKAAAEAKAAEAATAAEAPKAE